MRHDLSWKAATKCFAVGLLVFGLTVGLAPVVGAIPISAVDGTWQDADPAVATINNLVDPRTARWGTPFNQPNQSGYNWSPALTPFDAAIGTPFSVGTFNHLNFEITGTSITSINLNFSMTIDALPPLAGLFKFTHNETPGIGTSRCGHHRVAVPEHTVQLLRHRLLFHHAGLLPGQTVASRSLRISPP